MNLLIIPSWYPSKTHPLSGIFTKEQGIAISKHTEINVFISKWGHHDSYLNLRKPSSLLKSLLWRIKNYKQSFNNIDGVYEVMSPKIHWSHRILGGGYKQLVKPNIKNLTAIEKRFGKIDLIHAHVSYPAGIIAKVISNKLKIPYILTEHMSPFPFKTLLKNNKPIKEIELAFKFADRSIAVSNALSKKISSYDLKCSDIVSNLIDEEKFFPNRSKKTSRKKLTYLTLGGFNEQKGIDILLEAISLWMPEVGSCEFIIGGGIDKDGVYKNLAKDLGVDVYINWAGIVERHKVPNLFRNSDVYVLPSRHETFGVVCLEAIASGIPVIASRCGGPEDIINDINGMLINPNDPKELAFALEKISKSVKTFSRAEIRKDFEKRFSTKTTVKTLEKIYKATRSKNI